MTPEPILLELGFDLVPLAKQDLGGTLVERIARLREEIARKIGIMLPLIRIRDNFEIEGGQFIVFIKGMKVSKFQIDLVTDSSNPARDSTQSVIRYLRELILKYASDLMDYDQINILLEQNSVTYPALIAEFDRMFYRKSSLLKILKNLLRAGGSISNLPMILETVIEAENKLTSGEIVNLIQARMAIRA